MNSSQSSRIDSHSHSWNGIIAYVNDRLIGKGTVLISSLKLHWKDGRSEENLVVEYSSLKRYGHLKLSPKTSLLAFEAVLNQNSDKLEIVLQFDDAKMCTDVLDKLVYFVKMDPVPLWNVLFQMNTLEPFIGGDDNVLSSRMLKTQVTCIVFIGEYIFAGIGGSLNIFAKGYSKFDWDCVMSRQMFSSQNIYGIQSNNECKIVVYGGKMMSILSYQFSSGHARVKLLSSFHTNDWILDCIWLEGANEVALLTANNSLIRYNVAFSQPNNLPAVSSVSICSERCILYSGNIIYNKWDQIVVLAGTVFSTIVVWSNVETDNVKKVIHEMEGHKGVIFSVRYCAKTRRISSTSDDRTVRIWDVEFNDSLPNDWQNCKITLKFSLYGHSARVWKSVFAENGQVVSVGEDSRICLWTRDGTLDNQWNGHQNGEIWSLDYSYELQLVVTGGSDGGICLWPVAPAPHPYPLSCEPQQHPRCVGLSNSGSPFMVNSEGDVYLYHSETWTLCFKDSRFSSYCLQSVSPNRKFVAFASISGHLSICRFDLNTILKLIDHNVCDGRIFSMIWLSNSSIVICGPDGIFSIWNVSVDSLEIVKHADYVLPNSKERWITSCASNINYVVCGDRCGSLFLYSKNSHSKYPIFSLKKIHGHNGVTDVKFVSGKVATTGRDGRYREFVIENDTLQQINCYKLKLDWAAAILESLPSKRIVICFHEVFFIIMSVQERRPILKIDCGGGHRSWDCLVDSKTNNIYITYIKGKTVYFCCTSTEDVLCHTVVPGCHPKAINSAALVPLTTGKIYNEDDISGQDQLLVLGGEDTTLRLVSLTNGNNQIQLSVLQSHLSSIRTVTCYNCKFQKCVYIASGGGRGQLVMWKVLYSKEQGLLEIVELASYCVARSANLGTAGNNCLGESDAEMRVMDLQIFQRVHQLINIAASCSDGVLRLFTYDTECHQIHNTHNVEAAYCLLKVLFVEFEPFSFLITAGTSGSLSFYLLNEKCDAEEQLKNENNYSVSDLGINSCDYIIANRKLALATGGDNAVINVLIFSLNDKHFKMEHQWKNEVSHTCQVSGIKLCHNSLFTASLDQTVSVFTWELLEFDLNVKFVSRINLGIPDIHGTLVWKKSDNQYSVYVYGLGTQLLQLSYDR